MKLPVFGNLSRDNRGAAIIELALVAPMLAVLVIGATDVGNGFSRKLALEQGAQRAIEKQMQTTGDDTPEDTIKDEAALQADVDAVDGTVAYLRLCTGTAQTDSDTLCTSGQVTSLYLTVTVTDTYQPLFPFLGMGVKQADGSYLVHAKAGMRTQ
jgi:Flp pilus assembly protein TadG